MVLILYKQIFNAIYIFKWNTFPKRCKTLFSSPQHVRLSPKDNCLLPMGKIKAAFSILNLIFKTNKLKTEKAQLTKSNSVSIK